MSASDWAAFVLACLTILGIVSGGVRFLVKHYFSEMKSELKHNGGSSIKDQVTRLEERMNEADYMRRETNKKIDKIYEILLTHIARNSD